MSYKEWLCISEDEYLGEKFFKSIGKATSREISIIYLGPNTSLENDLVKKSRLQSQDLSNYINIRDDILVADPDITDEELDKKVFLEYVSLNEPTFYFMFDLDRFQEEFYKKEKNIEERILIEKLIKFAREVNKIEGIEFYIIPSFPAIATCAYYFEAFIENRDINYEVSEYYNRDCDSLCTMQMIL